MSQVRKLTQLFRRFGQLPPEIRHLIWSLALSDPRIIDVFAFNRRPTFASNGGGYVYKDDRIGISQSGIPILYVCREARGVALRIYKHGVDTEDQTGARFQQRRGEVPQDIINTWAARGCHFPCRRTCQRIPAEIRPRLYFDLEKDVFCLNKTWWGIGRHPMYTLRNYFGRDVLTNIRYLCLPYSMFSWLTDNESLRKSPTTAGPPTTSKSHSAAFPPVTLRDFPNLREIIINLDPKEGHENVPYDPEKISLFDIFESFRYYAATCPNWRTPEFRMVQDRAGLARVVELGLLAK